MDKEQSKHVYIGVDLHAREHVAVAIDCWNNKLGEIKVENRPSRFPSFLKACRKLARRGKVIMFGLEDVGGYGRSLAVYLSEQNQIVKEVNAKHVAHRRSAQVTVQKNDALDAECCARVLRDEWSVLRDANPVDQYWTIGQLVSCRQSLADRLSVLKRQFHAQLLHHYPSYKKFFTEIDGKTSLAFFQAFPSPRCLDDVSIDRLAAFLRRYSNNGLSETKARQILDLVRGDGDTTREEQEHRDYFVIRTLVKQIRFNKRQMVLLEERLQPLIHGLGYQLETLSGIDLVTAASMVSEIGHIDRFATSDKLARFAGIAPITIASGAKSKTYKSKQGNRTLHEIFYRLACRQLIVSRNKREPYNPLLYAYYEKKVLEGKTKHQAIVCVMRKLVNIIYSMMKNKTPYMPPTRHERPTA